MGLHDARRTSPRSRVAGRSARPSSRSATSTACTGPSGDHVRRTSSSRRSSVASRSRSPSGRTVRCCAAPRADDDHLLAARIAGLRDTGCPVRSFVTSRASSHRSRPRSSCDVLCRTPRRGRRGGRLQRDLRRDRTGTPACCATPRATASRSTSCRWSPSASTPSATAPCAARCTRRRRARGNRCSTAARAHRARSPRRPSWRHHPASRRRTSSRIGGMLPPDGVYAVRVGIDVTRRWRAPAVANPAPTRLFRQRRTPSRTHLFGFGDLYGRRASRSRSVRLRRGEVKFPRCGSWLSQIGGRTRRARVGVRFGERRRAQPAADASGSFGCSTLHRAAGRGGSVSTASSARLSCRRSRIAALVRERGTSRSTGVVPGRASLVSEGDRSPCISPPAGAVVGRAQGHRARTCCTRTRRHRHRQARGWRHPAPGRVRTERSSPHCCTAGASPAIGPTNVPASCTGSTGSPASSSSRRRWSRCTCRAAFRTARR